jgi:hypothetical protein
LRVHVAAALLLVGAALPGCCAWVRLLCPQPPVEGPPRLTRDSPEEAVGFVVDAFRRRSPGEVFESLHPDFVRDHGGFSGTEFATAYDLYEADFRADAERLATAPRRPTVHGEDGSAVIDVGDEEAGITLIFVNVPAGRVVLDDDVLPEIRDRLRLPAGGARPRFGSAVAVEGDEVRVTVGASLGGNGAYVDPQSVRRVEFHDDWLLREVRNARNIRFVEALAERIEPQGTKP